MQNRWWNHFLPMIVVLALAACGGKPTETVITPGGPTRTASVVIQQPTASQTPISSDVVSVSEFGFSQNGRALEYAFILENSSPNLAAGNISYQVTAFDQAGASLKTSEEKVGLILPGQTLGISTGMRLEDGMLAAKIAVQLNSIEYSPTESLPVINIEPATVYSTDNSSLAVSLLTNPYNHALTNLRINAIAYDSAGSIIGGGSSDLPFVLENSSIGVEVEIAYTGEIARVDLFAGLPNLVAAMPAYATLDELKLKLLEYGFGQAQEKGSFGMLLENPSALDFLQGSLYHLTAFSSDGKVIAVRKGAIPLLLPGQTLGLGGSLQPAAGTSIDHIEIQILTGEYVKSDPKLKFTFDNVTYLPGNPARISGNLNNPYAISFTRLRVYGIGRDAAGKIIGGGSTSLDGVAASSKNAVEIELSTSAAVSKVEMFTSVRNLDEIK
jgi:hypothetical protein